MIHAVVRCVAASGGADLGCDRVICCYVALSRGGPMRC
jgi:hypothetical protein